MPALLFGEEPHHLGEEPHHFGVEPESGSRRQLFATGSGETASSTATAVGGARGSKPANLHSGLAAAIEHARGGMVRQVTGQVVRVFRRKLVRSACGLSVVSGDLRSMAELEHKERYNNVWHVELGG